MTVDSPIDVAHVVTQHDNTFGPHEINQIQHLESAIATLMDQTL